MTPIQRVIGLLTIRLSHYEALAKQGVIPGVQDSYELEQIIGRIKELKHIIKRMEENDCT